MRGSPIQCNGRPSSATPLFDSAFGSCAVWWDGANAGMQFYGSNYQELRPKSVHLAETVPCVGNRKRTILLSRDLDQVGR
jgi:hypothetical protein